jgi:hypothetical protein
MLKDLMLNNNSTNPTSPLASFSLSNSAVITIPDSNDWLHSSSVDMDGNDDKRLAFFLSFENIVTVVM